MKDLHLVYENKGYLTVFKISPNYIKGTNLSAKILADNRSRNFLSVKVFKMDLEADFKLLFFGGFVCL